MYKETIKSAKKLQEIKEEYLKKEQQYNNSILVCGGAGCVSSDCAAVQEALRDEIKKSGIDKKINIIETGCMGICAAGPMLLIEPERIFYTKLTPEKTREIVKKHLRDGEVLEEYTFYDESLHKHIPNIDDIEFFKSQLKIVLENCGSIEYSDIKAYIARDGYMAAAEAIGQKSPEWVIQEVEKSGLRGRGGAGFPTAVKLKTGHDQPGKQKYMVCNADEGDPGAFMDRSIVEGDPHAVIEGMILSAYAIGANQGYVYIRAEYPIAVERLSEAIQQARACGLLGNNLFDTDYHFDLDIRIGAGAFVCGEETALLASIEGKRGEPKQKPPFPFQKGLHGCPTIINNVETLANIPKIVRKGGEWYAGFGVKNAPGTKVFALAGDVVNAGIIEVPIGTSIGDIIFKIGGGLPGDKKFKAVQIGGPSGGCITKENLNVPTDYESLDKLGAIMGSGGMVVMNEDTCMVDTARFFLDFIRDESCGQCAACRIGPMRMLEILQRITEGKGKQGDIELLVDIGQTIKQTAMCGLGQTAANPLLSTIEHFRDEYEEHIYQKYCRAGVCSELFISPCENTCPAGVNVPGYISLMAAGRFTDAYNLVMLENPFPAVCGRICTRPCEAKCRRNTVDEAVSIRNLKRFAADYAFKHEKPYTMKLSFPKNGKKVCVIGAGASGLTCAYYLTRIGYEVDVLEAENHAGGVLAFGVPGYRLPKDVLQHEIELIEQSGVHIIYNKTVGKNVEFKQLRNFYDAIYVATGTQFAQKVDIPGEDLEGVIPGIDFLKDVYRKKITSLEGTVAVIGGGNTAIDSARTAIRLGANRVVVLYRRTIDAMPAYREEVLEAIEEGVEIMELVSPTKFIGDYLHRLTGVECSRRKMSNFDSSGRRKTVQITDSSFVLEVDTVIPAVSQYADLPFASSSEIGVTRWGTFVIDRDSMMTTTEGVFAGGDVARGPDEVIWAIADGKKAASSIDVYLGGDGVLNKGEDIDIPDMYDSDELVSHGQFEMEMLEPEERCNNFDEVVLGFHKIDAIAEAMRCLHCDRR